MSVAIITGASSGIGKAFAKALDTNVEISQIWLLGRDTKRLSEVSEMLQTDTKRFSFDIGNREETKAFLSNIPEETKVKTLVNSAGFGRNGMFSQLSKDEQLPMVDVNCRAVVHMTIGLLPFLTTNSTIFNISSIAGFAPLGSVALYSATKSFVTSFSIALQSELQEKGIHVCTVTPGSVDTGFQKISSGNSNRKKKLFAKRASAVEVVAKAIKDAAKGKTFSHFGRTATISRFIRKLIPAIAVARFSQNKIYPEDNEVK